ncbi:hemerythrin domain-containing protein [Actinomadura sp. SCN-SB]|uniref:hemerythrin domain-containing protein n=1 Tax=Actinomadura sp. SCN-SB TaxID=3373092 RepID=UPI003750ED5B
MPAITDRGNTWEMVVVHRLFRREFRLAPGLIRAVADGDRIRAAVVGEFYLDLVKGLHHHHTSEDEMLWPLLLQRVGQLDTDLVRRMETQHQHLAVLLHHISELLPVWRDRADAGTRDELAAVHEQASIAIDEHLNEEENTVLPLVDVHITRSEWEALSKRGQEGLPKNSKAFVLLGAILEDATPAERAAFLRLLPAPLRLAWRVIGARIHRRAMTRLRGTD